MTTYLDLEAALATRFVHPGGAVATDRLLSHLQLAGGQRALDLGCGAGATASQAAVKGVEVVGFDSRAAMLGAAQRTCPSLRLVQGDANNRLPFSDAAFDAIWAESVVALLDPPRVLSELVRVLRLDGRMALNERIWRPGTTPAEAARINALSMRCFGIPAAAVEPLDRDGWAEMLERSGLSVEHVTAVDDLPHRPPVLLRREWLARQRRYLASPDLLLRSFRWRWLIRRHREMWARLESWLFVGARVA